MIETLKAVGHEVRNERGETVAECSSEARAIQFAAQPDMAEACKALVYIEKLNGVCSYCKSPHGDNSQCPVAMAERAIAKAERKVEDRR